VYPSLRKIWAAIATCLQARYNGGYSPQLLALLSPLLVRHHYPSYTDGDTLFTQVLMLSLKDRGRSSGSISSLVLTFWCATFAKEATVEYPDELRKSLVLFRRQGGRIELPGWQDEPSDEDITVVADSINEQQVTGAGCVCVCVCVWCGECVHVCVCVCVCGWLIVGV